MCATCERIKAEAKPTRRPLSAAEEAMRNAALAVAVLHGWFAIQPEGQRLFKDIPVDELQVARAHAEQARDLLDQVIARRSA